MRIPLDEVVTFDVVTHNPANGAVSDADSGPTYDVFEDATDTPILDDQTLTKRTALTGNYRGTFTASAANGFEAGKWYNAIATATVNSITGKTVAMTFMLVPAESSAGVPKTDLSHIDGSAVSTSTAQLGVNAVQWAGAATATDDIALKSALAKGTDITGFNDLSAAQVNTEVDTALVDARLDELLTADSDIDGAAPPTVGSVFHELLTKTPGSFTYDQTTDSVEALRDRGDAAWITATGFSTLTQADVRTSVGLASANLDTQLTTIDDFLDTEVAAIKAKTDSLTFTTANQVDANALAIDSSAAAATHLKDHALTAVPVTFGAGGTTTTAVLVNVDGAAASSDDDAYKDRVLIFTAPSGLKHQVTDITDYVGATKTATITAVTAAPIATATAIMV